MFYRNYFDQLNPIGYAIKNNHIDAVKLLLDNGAIPNSDNINSAIDKSLYDIADMFLEHGASMPLMRLYNDCKAGNLQHVIYVIGTKTADINALNPIDMLTPIAVACSLGHIHILEYIMNHLSVHEAIHTYESSLLHIAVRANCIKSIDFLLDRGVDINSVNGDGQTPLMEAMTYRSYDAYEHLCKKGATKHAQTLSFCSDYSEDRLHHYMVSCIADVFATDVDVDVDDINTTTVVNALSCH